MEKRRLRSARLFEKGYSSAEVARRLGVVRQVSHRWQQRWQAGGQAALASKGQAGRKSKMDAGARQRVVEALLSGPKSQGYKTELWTRPRGRALIPQGDRRALPCWPCLARLGALGFLKDLQRHLKTRLLIIWDGAALHRRKLVGDFLASTNVRIVAERFPPDAPELNPGEYLWAHLKCREIANPITTQAWELSFAATQALRRMRRRPSIIAACFCQAELWP